MKYLTLAVLFTLGFTINTYASCSNTTETQEAPEGVQALHQKMSKMENKKYYASIRDMVKNPNDLRVADPKVVDFTYEVCGFIDYGTIDPEFVGDKTPNTIDFLMATSEYERMGTKIETFFGDMDCSGFPVLYRAIDLGYCGYAYDFIRYFQKLRDQGIVSSNVLKEIIKYGPVHPDRLDVEGENFNLLKALDIQLEKPFQRAYHREWCYKLKPLLENELKHP